MNVTALLTWVIIFALAFFIVTQLVKTQPARNIFYAALAVILILVLVGAIPVMPIRAH